MFAIFAGLGAIIVGAGDFAGGAATRRDRPLRVTTLAFAVGFVLLLAVVPLFGGSPSSADLWWGAVSGLGGALGVATLYRGFQRSAMGLVAPIAAVVTAAVPVLGGLVQGERPSRFVVSGLVVGIVAIALVSMGPSDPSGTLTGSRLSAVTHGLVTGVGFGGMLLALTLIGEDAGVMPLALGRFSSFVAALLLALIVGGRPIPEGRTAITIAILSGLLTAAGNAFYYFALTVGPVVTSTVIYSMFPVSTVVLARVFYKERLRVTQLIGVGLALVATALLVI